ncbi:MAG TPA: hypothetical protein VFP61_08545 [Acidimicrobiales bacterium]|nr:hypothetical protein [Acidimicrobiales bacterium]
MPTRLTTAARALGALAVIATLSLAGAKAAAAAPPAPVFSMRPAAAGSAPLIGGHFTYAVPSGATLDDAVVVENLTAAPVTLALYPADLLALAGGGFAPTQQQQRVTGVGSWITLDRASVTLPPDGQTTVGFHVAVPDSTFSGDYGGAVVGQNAPSKGTGLAVQFRVALQVRIHVTGLTPTLGVTLGPLTHHTSARSATFTTTVRNTGNESIQFTGRLRVHTEGTSSTASVTMTPAADYLYPGQQVRLTGTWKGTPVWGHVQAAAVVTALPTVGAAQRFSTAPVTMRFLPWWLVVVAVIAALMLGAVALRMLRQRRELLERMRASRARRRAVRAFKQQLDSTVIARATSEPAVGAGTHQP